MTRADKAKFDMDLAPAHERELMIDRANAEAMKRLQGSLSNAEKPKPLANRRRKT